MTNHDPLCAWRDSDPDGRERCTKCPEIDKIRADERRKIAAAIEAERDGPKKRWSLAANEAFWIAARIARNGGRDV